MSLKVKVAANTIVQIIGKGITAFSTALITILLARSYGVEGFGEYTKMFSYVALFYLAVDFGLNAVVLQKNQDSSSPTLFANLLGFRLTLSMVWIFVALAILAFLPFNPLTNSGFTPLSKIGIILLLPTVITQSIFTTANAYFQSTLRYDRSVIASSIGSIGTVVLVYLFIHIHAPMLLTLVSYLIGSFIMAFSSLYLAGIKLFINRWSVALWWELFVYTLPLGATLLFNLVYFRVDTLILTAYRSTAEVGIYGLAYRFFEFPLTFPTFFMNALYPILLSKKNEGGPPLRITAKRALWILLLSSTIIVLGGFYFSPLITHIDPSFQSSIFPFRILLLSLPFFFISSLCMWLLITVKKNTLLAAIYGFALLINVSLNLVFIPQYGYTAAAITTGVSEAIVLLMTGYASIKALRNL